MNFYFCFCSRVITGSECHIVRWFRIHSLKFTMKGRRSCFHSPTFLYCIIFFVLMLLYSGGYQASRKCHLMGSVCWTFSTRGGVPMDHVSQCHGPQTPRPSLLGLGSLGSKHQLDVEMLCSMTSELASVNFLSFSKKYPLSGFRKTKKWTSHKGQG